MGTSAFLGFVLLAISLIGLANGQFASVGLPGYGNQYGQLGGFNQFSPYGQFGGISQFGGQQFGNQFGQGLNQFSSYGQFGGVGQFGGQQFGNAYGAYGQSGNFYRQQQREARRLQLQNANFLRGQQSRYGGIGGRSGYLRGGQQLGFGGFNQFGGQQLGQFGGFNQFGGQQFGQLGGFNQLGGQQFAQSGSFSQLGGQQFAQSGGFNQLGGQQFGQLGGFNQLGGQQFGQSGGQVGLARPPAGYVLASSTVVSGGGGFPIRSVDTSGDQKPQGSQIGRVATSPPADEQSNKPGCRSRSSSDGSWGHPLWWGWGDDCEEPAAKSEGIAASQDTVTGLPKAPQSQRMANTPGSPAESSPYDSKIPMKPSYSPLSQPAYQQNMAPMGYEGLNSNINGLYNSGIPLNPSNELGAHPGGQRIPFGQIGRPSGDPSLTTSQSEIANGSLQTPPGVAHTANDPIGVIPEPHQSPQTYVPNQPAMNVNQPMAIKPKQ